MESAIDKNTISPNWQKMKWACVSIERSRSRPQPRKHVTVPGFSQIVDSAINGTTKITSNQTPDTCTNIEAENLY